jgi:hypothetical protein
MTEILGSKVLAETPGILYLLSTHAVFVFGTESD